MLCTHSDPLYALDRTATRIGGIKVDFIDIIKDIKRNYICILVISVG